MDARYRASWLYPPISHFLHQTSRRGQAEGRRESSSGGFGEAEEAAQAKQEEEGYEGSEAAGEAGQLCASVRQLDVDTNTRREFGFESLNEGCNFNTFCVFHT